METRTVKTSFDDLWKDAEARFKDKTGRPLRDSAPPKTLDDVLIEIEKRYGDESSADDRRKKNELLTNVQNVLTCVQVLGGIASYATSQVFGAADFCFNAVSFLCSIPTRIKTFYEALSDLFAEINGFLQSFEIYRRLEKFAHVDAELLQATNKVLVCLVDICAIAVSEMSPGKLAKLKRLTSVSLFGDSSAIRDELKKFRTLVDRQSRISDAVTLEHVVRSRYDQNSSMKVLFAFLQKKSLHDGEQLDFISTSIRHIHSSIDEQKNVVHEKDAHGLLDWLSTSNQSEYFTELSSKHLEGTGNWLVESSKFKAWRQGSRRCLLLHGIAGSGKTFLCAAAIKYLNTERRRNPSETLCYFFFRNQSSQQPSDLLRHVVRSACNPDQEHLRTERHNHLRRTFMGKFLRGETPSDDDLLAFLAKIREKIYLIVDAVDECGKIELRMEQSETRRAVTKLLTRLGSIDSLNVLISCREGAVLTDVKKALEPLQKKSSFAFIDFAMEDPDVNADIQRLIDDRLQENLKDFLEDYPEWNRKIRQHIVPDRMFLVVARQLDILEQRIDQSHDWASIEKTLIELPTDPDGVYTLILREIPNEKKDMALAVLKWLICAQRPLHLSELRALISSAHPGPFNIMKTFSSLLAQKDKTETKDFLVEFAHDTTIREYLLSEKSGYFQIDQDDAHRCFAKVCLEYLRTTSLEETHKSGQGACLSCPMDLRALEYATNNWHEHAYNILRSRPKAHLPLPLPWSKKSNEASFIYTGILAVTIQYMIYLWLSLLRRLGSSIDGHTSRALRLQSKRSGISSTQSLHAWSQDAENSLPRSSDYHEQDHKILCEATLVGYQKICEVLLLHGGDVDSVTGPYNALMAASTQNYKGMIRCLLGCGSDGESSRHRRLTGYRGYSDDMWRTNGKGNAKSIVSLLLKHGANPNAKNKYQQTALHLAAASNQASVVDFLLDKVSDPNASDYSGATALHWAAVNGHSDMLPILLSRGGDVNARSLYKGKDPSPETRQLGSRFESIDFEMINEADSCHEEVAEGLLTSGANPKAFDDTGSTALHWACCRGLNKLARLLVEYGADVNAARTYERQAKTPLIEAVRNAKVSSEVLKLFLERGADPNIEDSTWFENRMALHEAAMCGNQSTVRLLLDYGADPNAQDLNGRTPADLGRAGGHEDIAVLLERSNQGIEAQGGKGETALHMAAENNHANFVLELLNNGADVTARSKHGRTVLHSAAGRASATLFRTLMQYGADPTLLADDKWSVLHEAAGKGNIDIIELLIEQGAIGINAEEINGSTPLAIAVKSNQEAAVRYFLEREGIPADVPDWRGHRLLHHASEEGYTKMVEILLKQGNFDINAREKHYSRTPLVLAAMHGHKDSASLLLEYEADVHAKDSFGCTALAYAQQNQDDAFVDLLEKRGAHQEATSNSKEEKIT
ncbi:MAG: hypothetical protein M1821_000574 [Bathelium mastoideum]|nr:MAG: hypothetical protein M1821_000574 [Bathelium mastoideum]